MTLFELVGKIAIDSTEAKQGISDAMQTAKNGVSQIGESMTAVSKKTASMAKEVAAASVAASGLIAGAYKSWKEVDEALDTVAAGTGATGEALEELQQVAKNVYTSLPVDIQETGQAVADINTRLGLQGEALEEATEQFLKYAEVNGSDVSTSIETVAKAMADAGIDTDELTDVLDELTAASQSSGMTVDELASSLSTNGVQMRELGYTTEETIALLATMEKNGVNTSTVLAGMKKAMASFADEGTDVAEGFSSLWQGIQDGSISAADAMDVFGTRSGAIMYQYIKEEKLNYQDMLSVVQNASGQLSASYEEMLDPADRAKVAMNNLKQAGADFFDVLQEAALPALEAIIKGLQGLTQWFENLPSGIQTAIVGVTAFLAILSPVMLFISGVTGAIGGLISFFGSLGGVIASAGTALSGGFAAALTVITGPIGIIIAAVAGLIAAFILLYKNNEGFREKVGEIWDGIKNTFAQAFETIKTAITETVEWVRNFYNEHKETFNGILDALKYTVETFFTNLGNSVLLFSQLLTGNFEGALETLRNMFNDNFAPIIEFVKNFVNSFTNIMTNGVNSATSTIQSKIQTATSWITNKVQSLYNGIAGIASRIRNLFNFNFTLPKLKLPHFNITPSGWNVGDLMKGKIPSLSVKWYKNAMDTGVILDNATPFGVGADGTILGAGDSAKGSETVVGTSSLMNMIASTVQQQNAQLVEAFTSAVGGMNITVDNTFAVDGTALYKKSSEYTQDQISRKYKNALYAKGA